MNGSYLYFVNKHLLVGRYWDFNAFFSTFNYITATSAHIHVLTSASDNILFKSLAVFQRTIVEKMTNSTRGMNPAVITIINLRKDTGRGSSKLTPLLKSCTLAIELKGARLDNSTESARPSQHVDPSFMIYEVFKYIRVRAWLSGKAFDS